MTHINAGTLDQRVTFDAPSSTRSASGAEVPGWTPVLTCWAAVLPITGRERLNANQVLANVDTRIRIRWSTQAAAMTAKHRIRHGSTVYNILTPPINVDSAKVVLEFLCQTGMNPGG